MSDIDSLENNPITIQYNLPKKIDIIAAAGEYGLYKHPRGGTMPYHWVHADGTYRAGFATQEQAMAFAARL